MSLIQIPLFDGGLVTNSDPEDISNSAATESKNFEIDIPGKLVKRKGRGSATTMSGDHIGQIIKWTSPDFTPAKWIYFETQTRKIRSAASDFGTNADIKTLATVNDIQINNFGRQLRFANGLENKPGILQHIDREFFFGSFDPTATQYYDDAPPSYPTKWNYAIAEETGSNGTHAAGFYYYKFVPVFDGVQEAPFGETYAYKTTSSANRTLNVSLTVDKTNTTTWNPRITALKLYRSYSPTATGDLDPVYYNIRTIPVNTKSTHDDNNAYTSSYVGTTVWADGFNFSAYEPSGSTHYWIKVGSDWYHIADSLGSNTNVAIVDKYYNSGSLETFTGFASGDEIWNGNFGVYVGTATAVTNYESASAVTNGTGTNGYAGNNVVFNDSWSWADNQRNDWTVTAGSVVKKVITSTSKVVRVDSRYTAPTTNGTVTLNDGYYYTVNSNDVTLTVSDWGLADGALHPLNAITKTVVNHKHSVYMAGRQFVGNVRLDPDTEAEDHEDWIIYSELLQPDVLPITNYIQIKDTQGGSITGLIEHLGALVVFMENGVYRLNIPSTNPAKFSLLEAEENFGCVATNSIIQVGSNIAFAGRENAYSINSSFEITPITEPIKDIYQAATNIENSRFFYDPKKNRILCRFGDDKQNIYALDLLNSSWYQLDMGSTDVADLFAIDESLNVYSITNVS
mgnify:CR=1 FL=1|tara:strand:- start:13512 stop:15557 length:2046 start_codon:yes stop_codon:yes gene_type:complete